MLGRMSIQGEYFPLVIVSFCKGIWEDNLAKGKFALQNPCDNTGHSPERWLSSVKVLATNPDDLI